METMKYKSEKSYKVGTILFDEHTHEAFEVLDCKRIDIGTNTDYGITVKQVEIYNKKVQ